MTEAAQLEADHFLALSRTYPVLDVRSPGEYAYAHMPGAYSFPLFTNEERAVVGTAYKQQSREQAIKLGLDFFGVKMRQFVETAEEILKNHRAESHPSLREEVGKDEAKTILVHCWRGGMRSAAVAWLLNFYGFRAVTLAGGYKSFRKWVLNHLENPGPLKVIGGYTGSGKTCLLQQLRIKNKPVLDLESIACHKGSAFGALGQPPQPSQEQFENLLAVQLAELREKTGPDKPIWLEDESRRIGTVHVPDGFHKLMKHSPLYFMEVPFEERLDHVMQEYGNFRKEDLLNPIMRIRKRLGGVNTRDAVNFLFEDNVKECFRILLKYYDKFYGFDLEERKQYNSSIFTIACRGVNSVENFEMLFDEPGNK